MFEQLIDRIKQKKQIFNSFLINNLLLLSGLITIVSGLVIQLGFHMGETDGASEDIHEIGSKSMTYEQVRTIDPTKTMCGYNYSDWSAIHKFAIVFLTLFTIYHVYTHWKWFKGVIAKKLITKNLQVITLSVLFLLVAITGLVPWAIDLLGSTSVFRFIFIEIHDKLALILLIYLILHLIKRNKWFMATYIKLKT